MLRPRYRARKKIDGLKQALPAEFSTLVMLGWGAREMPQRHARIFIVSFGLRPPLHVQVC